VDLELRRSSSASPELHFCEAAPAEFGVRRGLLRRRSLYAEISIFREKAVFSHVVCCDEITLQEILLLRRIQG
jgi:hypothetical protein